MATQYDTPIGVGGRINNNTGQVLSGPMAGQPAINSSVLQQGSTIQLPPPPTPTDITGTYNSGNATIAANSPSITPDPMSQSQDIFSKYLSSMSAPPDTASIYNQDYANSGIAGLQGNVNTDINALNNAQQNLAGINAQLAGINAQGQVMNLQQEGRQAPMFQISGQQQANDRATAIRALPLQAQALAAQAQVAAAQGKAQLSQNILQQAQQHLDTVYQIHAQDAKAQYDYKRSVIAAVYDFANKQEQRQLDAQQKQADQAFQMQMSNIQAQHQQDLARLQASLQNQGGGTPTIKSINGVDMQWNPTTQKWENPSGVGQSSGVGAPPQSAYQIQGNQRIVQSVDELLPQVNAMTAGIGGQVTGFIPGTPAYNFKSQLDTLKANIAFGALTQMREASKTGGALGQISDAEERLLSATLGALDPGQSPQVLKTQLNKIKDSIARWNQAVSGNQASGTLPSGITWTVVP